MEPKAFWKSMKQLYMCRPFHVAFSAGSLRIKIWWLVFLSWILLAFLTGVAPSVFSAFLATPSSRLYLSCPAVRLLCSYCNLLNLLPLVLWLLLSLSILLVLFLHALPGCRSRASSMSICLLQLRSCHLWCHPFLSFYAPLVALLLLVPLCVRNLVSRLRLVGV